MKSSTEILQKFELEEYEEKWQKIYFSLTLFRFIPDVSLADIIRVTIKDYPKYTDYIYQTMDNFLSLIPSMKLYHNKALLKDYIFLGIIDKRYYSEISKETFHPCALGIKIDYNNKKSVKIENIFAPFTFISLPADEIVALKKTYEHKCIV